MMTRRKTEEVIRKKSIEDKLRSELEETLSERVSRSVEMRSSGTILLTPVTHFASPALEAFRLYRDGYFYGCISLTQAVVEALTRFICTKDNGKFSKSFSVNVSRMKYLDDKTKELFTKIWGTGTERHDFHHLNPDVESDRKELERMSKRNVTFLLKIENEVFSSTIKDGSLVSFKYPRYWSINEKRKALVRFRVEY